MDNRVTQIGDNLFKNMGSLKTIEMPGVVNIGSGTFQNCSSLTSVDLSTIESLGNKAFNGCTSLKTVVAPRVSIVSNGTFQDCGSLTSADLSNATLLGTGAFKGCRALEGVEIPNVTSLRADAFQDCGALRMINLSGVETIGEYAFRNCKSLASVNLASATSLEHDAFIGCTSLRDASMPKVKTIQADAFRGCTALASVAFHGAIEVAQGAFRDCGALQTVDLSKVRTIGVGAFYGCGSLVSVDLSASTTIGNTAFQGCARLHRVDNLGTAPVGNSVFEGCTALKKIDLYRVESIGQNAFKGCASLEEVDLSNTTSLGAGAFEGCTSLIRVGATGLTDASKIGSTPFKDCTSLVDEPSVGENAHLFRIHAPADTGLVDRLVEGSPYEGCTAYKVVKGKQQADLHTTLQRAIDGLAAGGEEIVLLRDESCSGPVTIRNHGLSLDLNGHSLSFANEGIRATADSGEEVAIQNGTVVSTGGHALKVDKGKVSLKDCVFRAPDSKPAIVVDFAGDVPVPTIGIAGGAFRSDSSTSVIGIGEVAVPNASGRITKAVGADLDPPNDRFFWKPTTEGGGSTQVLTRQTWVEFGVENTRISDLTGSFVEGGGRTALENSSRIAVESGTSISFSVEPATGYCDPRVTVDGTQRSPETTYKVDVGTAASMSIGTGATKMWEVTLDAGPNLQCEISNIGDRVENAGDMKYYVAPGSTIDIEVGPEDPSAGGRIVAASQYGYDTPRKAFDGVIQAGAYSVGIDGDGTISLKAQYRVDTAPGPNGSIRADQEWCDGGANVTVTATPDKGYKISEVETGVGGPSLVRDPTDGTRYTFAMPARDVTVSATFVRNDDAWTTVIFDSDGGELTGATEVEVVIGEPLSSVDDFSMPTAKMHGFKDEGWSRTKTSIGETTTAIEIGVDTPITAGMLDAKRKLTLYPIWTEDPEQQLTITFDADGECGGRIKGTNESVAIRYAKYDSVLGGFRLADDDVPKAEVAGYTYDDWVDRDGKWLFDYGGRFYRDVQFTVQWKTDGSQWTRVVFDPSPGTTDDRIEFEVITGRPLSSADGFSMPVVTRPGYLNPTVWETGNGNVIGESTVITEEMGGERRTVTLTPQWELDYSQWWTVTFDANRGQLNGASEIHVLKGKNSQDGIRDGESFPQKPTRTGYTFVGWKDGDAPFDDAATVTEDITVKADWKVDETSSEWAAVTFDANGGTPERTVIHVLKGKSSQDGIRDGESYPADPTRIGYRFDEWFVKNDQNRYSEKFEVTTRVDTDRQLEAKWIADETSSEWATITFDAAGGVPEPTAIHVLKGKNSQDGIRDGESFPQKPTRTGYTFVGWKDGDAPFDDAATVTEDITVKADWKVDENAGWVSVTFDANGGVPEPTAIHVLKGKSPSNGIRDGESYPADPTKTGYSFGGWWLGEDRFTNRSIVKENLAVTAEWVVDETSPEWATVTFDAAGGAPEPTAIHVLKGKNSRDGIRDGESFPQNPTRRGYIFIEWLADETELTADTAVGGDMTATASWVVDGSLAAWCTVTYDAEGGAADRKSERVVRSGTVGSLPGATREGWVLAGWYDGDRKVGDAGGESSPIMEDVELHARWTAPAALVEVTVDDGIRAEIGGEPFHGGSVPPGTVIHLETDGPGSIRASDGTELGSGGDYVVRGPVDFTIEKEKGWFPWLLLLLVLLAAMCAATYCHRRRSQRDRE